MSLIVSGILICLWLSVLNSFMSAIVSTFVYTVLSRFLKCWMKFSWLLTCWCAKKTKKLIYHFYSNVTIYLYAPLTHSVCLSVCLCMCYSRQRRCARKGGCPASPLVTIEGGQGPALGPPGRLSTCLMGSEGVLTLAVRVVILLWVSAPWIGWNKWVTVHKDNMQQNEC